MFSNNTEELAQNKLILLYIIKTFPNKFTKNQLTEFILEKNYLNFFLIQQYLSELIESEFIEINIIKDEEKYSISEKGEIALNYFDSKVPENIKKDLKHENKVHKSIKKEETQVVAEFFKKEDEQYLVNLKLVENNKTLFSLYIDVASEEQAKLVCDAWRSKTESIYSNIINLFIEQNLPI